MESHFYFFKSGNVNLCRLIPKCSKRKNHYAGTTETRPCIGESETKVVLKPILNWNKVQLAFVVALMSASAGDCNLQIDV